MTPEMVMDVATLAHRLEMQIRAGCLAMQDRDFLMAELHLSAANVTTRSIQALCASCPNPPAMRPMRRLALVVSAKKAETDEPEWFGRKANDGDPDAA